MNQYSNMAAELNKSTFQFDPKDARLLETLADDKQPMLRNVDTDPQLVANLWKNITFEYNCKATRPREPQVLLLKYEMIVLERRRNLGINENTAEKISDISDIYQEIAELKLQNESMKKEYDRIVRSNFESRMTAYHKLKVTHQNMTRHQMNYKCYLQKLYLKQRKKYNDLLAKKANSVRKPIEEISRSQNIESGQLLQNIDSNLKEFDPFADELNLFLEGTGMQIVDDDDETNI